jgi:hypothetical protein
VWRVIRHDANAAGRHPAPIGADAGSAARCDEGREQVTTVTRESDVAEAVYRAANDASGQLRFPAGPDAVALAGRARRQFV